MIWVRNVKQMGRNVRKNLDLHNLVMHNPSLNPVITYFILLVKKKQLSSVEMPKYLIVTNNNNKKPNTQEMKIRKWKFVFENVLNDSSFLQFENSFAGPLTYILRVQLFKFEDYKLGVTMLRKADVFPYFTCIEL